MKFILATGLILSALAAPASAAIVEFRGGFCISARNAACAVDGWNVGDCFLMRYSPPGLGTNGPSTEITLLGQSFGDNYELKAGSLIGTTLKAVDGTHVGRTGYGFAATMRISKQSPAPLTATSPQVTLSGVVSRFGDTPGCVLSFNASGVRRP